MGTLTPVQATRLEELESKIESGLTSFIEVGQALLEIHDGKLYAETDKTFEDYCQRRFSLNRRHAYRMIEANKAVQSLNVSHGTHTDGGPILPDSERVGREVAKVPEKKRAKVWKMAVESANGQPTAAQVREVAKEVDKPPKSGKQVRDPRAWQRWDDLFGKLKRATDDLPKAEKFNRAVQHKLNEVFDIAKDWRRAVR